MSNINEVRQIMMNELGLTRESLRNMAQTLVEETVDKHIKNMIASGYVEKHVAKSVEAALRVGSYSSDSMKKLIAKAAGEAFEAQVRKDLFDRTIGDLVR